VSVVSLDGLGFSALVWILKFQPSKDTETSMLDHSPVHFRDQYQSSRTIKVKHFVHNS
jgi:hypothetical protein